MYIFKCITDDKQFIILKSSIKSTFDVSSFSTNGASGLYPLKKLHANMLWSDHFNILSYIKMKNYHDINLDVYVTQRVFGLNETFEFKKSQNTNFLDNFTIIEHCKCDTWHYGMKL